MIALPHRPSAAMTLGMALILTACVGADGRGDRGPDDRGNGEEDDPPCLAVGTVDSRIEQCRAMFPGEPLLEATAARPLDAGDPLYYVNRWYSIDPCFPFAPQSFDTLQQYVDPAGLEPELVGHCGSYGDDVRPQQIPAAYTDGRLQQLRPPAWESEAGGQRYGFLPMFEAALAEAGVRLVVISSFRSADTQIQTYASWGGDAQANVYSAEPLHSEHQLGTTIDVSVRSDDGSIFPVFDDPIGFHQSPAGQWLVNHAHRFGIVVTYEPHKLDEHQYKAEPWHLRYVGPTMATLAHACDLSTEELLAHHYQIAPLPPFSNMGGVYAATADDGWEPETCADYGPVELPETDSEPDPEQGPGDETPAGWVWPVPRTASTVQDYGNPIEYQSCGFHTGLDIAGTIGDPIVAASDGLVVHVGPMWFDGAGQGRGPYAIILDHGDGLYSTYGHNDAALVAVGQAVRAGDTIAEIGTLGYSLGPHLHFEILEGTAFTGEWQQPFAAPCEHYRDPDLYVQP